MLLERLPDPRRDRGGRSGLRTAPRGRESRDGLRAEPRLCDTGSSGCLRGSPCAGAHPVSGHAARPQTNRWRSRRRYRRAGDARLRVSDYWGLFLSFDIADELEHLVAGEAAPGVPESVLTTILFTDIVGFDERARELGDRCWRDLLHSTTRPYAASSDDSGASNGTRRATGSSRRSTVPRERSAARRRSSTPRAARARSAGRRSHGRVRAPRREGRGRRTRGRRARMRRRRGRRGVRLPHGQGPRRRLGPHLRGPRVSRAEGRRRMGALQRRLITALKTCVRTAPKRPGNNPSQSARGDPTWAATAAGRSVRDAPERDTNR